MTMRQALLRLMVVVVVVLGVNYVTWRWLFSVNWSAWPIAVPLVVAETYSLVDSLLFCLTMWRRKERGEPDPPDPEATVDVLVTTYNEPLDLVMTTARAAKAISFPHETWILDDGNRPELRALAESEGIGWITRSADWDDRPRHAKAGNINNALLATEGEFLLILDADQVPEPQILDRTLGYFRDERMAVVQTPQFFVNVPDDDPLGSQAPLFYGPIQEGKDGWNAAFFCGSNAVLRREALMQLGVWRYAGEIEIAVHRALRTSKDVLAKARADLGSDDAHATQALDKVAYDLGRARRELGRGVAIADVTYRFQRRVASIARELVSTDVDALHADLAAIAELEATTDEAGDAGLALVDDAALRRMSERDWSPLGALATVQSLVSSVDVDRGEEAQPVMPMATISVTEDMATCMRLHALGWSSAYHGEQLAFGLAPEDLKTMLTQRLRWAQGTMQVMFRENPMVQQGLTVAQKLMYLGTMWSYLSGFFAVVYLAAPIIYLTLGVLPVDSLGSDFFVRLIPFLVVNQLLFLYVGWKRRTWRGLQYSLALFPVWIKAFTSAFGSVFLGRALDFAVTPKVRTEGAGRPWHLVKPQLVAMGALVAAAGVGLVRLQVGQASPLGTWVNLAWVVYDLLVLGVVVKAVRYDGWVDPETPSPPIEQPRHKHRLTTKGAA
ncbi:MAG: glycosyltransferase [Nocardioidaceae bacterium]|nr:glycosyltransferase [Nocardioidaceae bacterium]